MKVVIIILAILLLCLLIYLYIRNLPVFGTFVLTCGAVKSGKTLFSVWIARRKYKRALFSWYLKCIKHVLAFDFLKDPFPEKPLFYSNIKHPFKYVPLTQSLLLRKKRFRYGSVIFIDEASLVADSQLFKDDDRNEYLMLFNKLIGHELRGGCIIYNTQNVEDLHYSIKRCIGDYFYTYKFFKWFPFFDLIWVRNLFYNPNGVSENTINNETRGDMKLFFVRKKTRKLYDRYAFSVLTDNLEVVDNEIKSVNLKQDKVLSFRKFKTLKTIKNGDKYQENKEIKH